MIPPARRQALIPHALRLSQDLGRFRTPGSGEPVDPGRLGEVMRFLQGRPDPASLASFFKLLPDSYMREMSQSARPQLVEITRLLSPLIKAVPDTEELCYVLGWARRLLSTAERQGGAPQGGQGERRGGQGQSERRPGGPGRGPGGRR